MLSEGDSRRPRLTIVDVLQCQRNCYSRSTACSASFIAANVVTVVAVDPTGTPVVVVVIIVVIVVVIVIVVIVVVIIIIANGVSSLIR